MGLGSHIHHHWQRFTFIKIKALDISRLSRRVSSTQVVWWVLTELTNTQVTLLSSNDGVTVRGPLQTASLSLNPNVRTGNREPWKGWKLTLMPRLSFNLVSCSWQQSSKVSLKQGTEKVNCLSRFFHSFIMWTGEGHRKPLISSHSRFKSENRVKKH